MALRDQKFMGGEGYVFDAPTRQWISFGNAPAFSLSPTLEKIEHMDWRNGPGERDFSAMRTISWGTTLTFDDMKPENLEMFFLGEASKVTQVASTQNVTETYEEIQIGRLIFLGTTLASPIGVRNVLDVVVTVDAEVKVAGMDYVVDAESGAIRFLPASRGGSVADGATVTVTYGVAGSTRDRIISGQNVRSTAMRFVERGGVGNHSIWNMPSVAIFPEGEMSLIGDDWRTGTFQIDVFKSDGFPAVIIDGTSYTE